jgi:hypothetical protein
MKTHKTRVTNANKRLTDPNTHMQNTRLKQFRQVLGLNPDGHGYETPTSGPLTRAHTMATEKQVHTVVGWFHFRPLSFRNLPACTPGNQRKRTTFEGCDADLGGDTDAKAKQADH